MRAVVGVPKTPAAPVAKDDPKPEAVEPLAGSGAFCAGGGGVKGLLLVWPVLTPAAAAPKVKGPALALVLGAGVLLGLAPAAAAPKVKSPAFALVLGAGVLADEGLTPAAAAPKVKRPALAPVLCAGVPALVVVVVVAGPALPPLGLPNTNCGLDGVLWGVVVGVVGVVCCELPALKASPVCCCDAAAANALAPNVNVCACDGGAVVWAALGAPNVKG